MKLRDYLDRVREPRTDYSKGAAAAVSAVLFAAGALLGVLQKRLDGTAINELPLILQRIDIVNFFGRLAIWILLGTAIAVFSKRPRRASLNVFLFLIGMVAGYYVYCRFALGFLPVSYMMIWIVLAVAGIFLAPLCWYARGEGPLAVILSAVILGVLFSQAFLITQGFFVTHWTEVICWVIGVLILIRKPKGLVIELVLSIGVALLYQLFIPYWG